MGLIDSIAKAIFSHPLAQTQKPVTQQETPTGPAGTEPPSAPGKTVGSVATSAAQAAGQAASVDVQALLSKIASQSPEKLDWQHSIVDLLKLVGHDSSHAAREALAKELGYSSDMGDSVAMNEFLLKAVMAELAKSGGKL